MAWALVYVLVAGIGPIVLIEDAFDNGSVFVRLYSHLFLYPRFFGWITILLLIPALNYVAALPTFTRYNAALFLAGPVAFAGVSTFSDVYWENDAPYEVRAALVNTDPRLAGHFAKPVPTEEEQTAYARRMGELLADPGNWSPARYLHYATVFLVSAQMLLVLFIAVFLAHHRLSRSFRDNAPFKRALVYCSLAILVSFLWVLMRHAFIMQKAAYFPEADNPVRDYTVAALVIVATLAMAAALFVWLGEKLPSIITLAFGSFSILTIWQYPDVLATIFDKDAGLAPYWTILAGIAAVWYAFAVAQTLNGKPRVSRPVH